MKNIKFLVAILVTAIICTTTGVVATIQIQANQIKYTKNGTETTVDSALNTLYDKASNRMEYVALFSGAMAIDGNQKKVSSVYIDNNYAIINEDGDLVFSEAGTYQIIGTVAHSPYSSTFSSTLDIKLNDQSIGTAVNDFGQYVIYNNEVTISSNDILSFVVYSNANKGGTAGSTIVIFKK